MNENRDVPVYLFTGFLEAGKTKFIQETLEDKRFCNGERTLLLICEEGEEEYAPEQFADPNVVLAVVEDQADLTEENLKAWLHDSRAERVVVEDQADLTEENLKAWLHDSRAERVVVEYNGMWMLDLLYQAMPENWAVYQEFMFADATTFLTYNNNMRQLVYDKLKSCELVVFNRFQPDMDKMAFHKIVRGASRRSDIAYEYANGKVVYDDIQDPLPFDVNAPVIQINDEDYALWYRDMSEEPKKYEGKTVKFKCRALKRGKLPKGCFVVGRHVMTCCVEDIQFAGLVCQWDKADLVQDESWMILTAKINYKFHRAYGKRGPVLTYLDSALTSAPAQDVATFY